MCSLTEIHICVDYCNAVNKKGGSLKWPLELVQIYYFIVGASKLKKKIMNISFILLVLLIFSLLSIKMNTRERNPTFNQSLLYSFLIAKAR